MGDLPHRVKPDPEGRYTADVHVTPDGHARIGDRLYTPEEFADILRRGGDYDGRPVRLIGCDAGSNDFAQRLSRALDTEVLAPDKPAWTDSNGTVFSSDYERGPDGRLRPRIPPNGEWNVHRPDRGSVRGSEDGFTPDTAEADKTGVDGGEVGARGRARQDEWLDRPQSDGQTLREKLGEKDWIEDNYYQRRSPKGHLELVIRPNKPNADEIPPLDLRRPDENDGPDVPRIRDEEKGIDYVAQPKSDRPPVEASDHDSSRARVVEPAREDAHVTDRNDAPGSHGGGQDESAGSVVDTDSTEAAENYADASGWREEDYRGIDELISDREQKLHRLRATEEETDAWTVAHNARNDASEALGEKAAEHAVRDQVHNELRAHHGNDVTLRAHPEHPPGSQRFQAVDGQGRILGEIEPMHPVSGAKPGPGRSTRCGRSTTGMVEVHIISSMKRRGPGRRPARVTCRTRPERSNRATPTTSATSRIIWATGISPRNC